MCILLFCSCAGWAVWGGGYFLTSLAFTDPPRWKPDVSDIMAAKEASVTSVAVTWGHQSLERLLRGDPDYLVRFPQDLIEVIEK